jgi:hypothetical protein
MIEDIRQELAKGCYQMDAGELPYTGKAQIMAEKLWAKGYRPREADSAVYHGLHYQESRVEWALKGVIHSILQAEKLVSADSTPGTPSRSFLLGLHAARNIVEERLERVQRAVEHWNKMTDEAIGKEWADD